MTKTERTLPQRTSRAWFLSAFDMCSMMTAVRVSDMRSRARRAQGTCMRDDVLPFMCLALVLTCLCVARGGTGRPLLLRVGLNGVCRPARYRRSVVILAVVAEMIRSDLSVRSLALAATELPLHHCSRPERQTNVCKWLAKLYAHARSLSDSLSPPSVSLACFPSLAHGHGSREK